MKTTSYPRNYEFVGDKLIASVVLPQPLSIVKDAEKIKNLQHMFEIQISRDQLKWDRVEMFIVHSDIENEDVCTAFNAYSALEISWKYE